MLTLDIGPSNVAQIMSFVHSDRLGDCVGNGVDITTINTSVVLT